MKKETKVQDSHVSQQSSNEMLSAALQEWNDLIAKFDGYEYYPNDSINGVKGVYRKKDKMPMLLAEFKYTSSWERLMPVVEKIEGFGFTFIIDGRSAYYYENGKIMEGKSGIGETKIEAVWKTVIKFIKWYNDNAVSIR